jgi:hypothetical protein
VFTSVNALVAAVVSAFLFYGFLALAGVAKVGFSAVTT